MLVLVLAQVPCARWYILGYGSDSRQNPPACSQQTSSIFCSTPSCGPRSSFKVRPNSSSKISKQIFEIAGSYLPFESSSRMNASGFSQHLIKFSQEEHLRCAQATSYQLNTTPFSLSVFLIKSLPSGGT
jgi:hypothetical protein